MAYGTKVSAAAAAPTALAFTGPFQTFWALMAAITLIAVGAAVVGVTRWRRSRV